MTDTLENKVKLLEQRVETLEKVIAGGAKPVIKEKKMSPKEYLMKHGSSDDVRAAFLLACYAEYELGMKSVSREDVEKLFRTAGLPVPQNTADKIRKNIRKGLMTDADKKKDGEKAWMVTMSGVTALGEKK